jgi:hypothetical protein
VVTGLTRKERIRLEEAERTGVLVDTAHKRPDLSNAWWRRCESEGRPYVVVRPVSKQAEKRAAVTVDLLPMGAQLTDEGCERIEAAFSRHAVVGEVGEPFSGSVFFRGRVRITIANIPADAAEEVAAEVYHVACTEHVVLDKYERLGLSRDHVSHTPGAVDLKEHEEALHTPQAVDLEEPKETKRIKIETYRILRDTTLTRKIKALHENRCQICGTALPLPDGSSCGEAHHIQPLGSPHHGPDIEDNILVLCPNHHALCDLGAISIRLDEIRTHPDHSISREFIDYHNEKIAGS